MVGSVERVRGHEARKKAHTAAGNHQAMHIISGGRRPNGWQSGATILAERPQTLRGLLPICLMRSAAKNDPVLTFNSLGADQSSKSCEATRQEMT